MGWDGMGRDGTGRDGTGRDGTGWDGMGSLIKSTLAKTNLFADDITDSASNSMWKMLTRLQTKLQALDKWATNETKSMLMASQQNLRSLDNSNNCLNLTVHGKQIGHVTH